MHSKAAYDNIVSSPITSSPIYYSLFNSASASSYEQDVNGTNSAMTY